MKGLMVFIEGSLAGGLEVALVAGVLDLVVDCINVFLEAHFPVGNIVAGWTLERTDNVLVCADPW